MTEQPDSVNMKHWPAACLLAVGLGIAVAIVTGSVEAGIGAGAGTFLLLARFFERKHTTKPPETPEG